MESTHGLLPNHQGMNNVSFIFIFDVFNINLAFSHLDSLLLSMHSALYDAVIFLGVFRFQARIINKTLDRRKKKSKI